MCHTLAGSLPASCKKKDMIKKHMETKRSDPKCKECEERSLAANDFLQHMANKD